MMKGIVSVMSGTLVAQIISFISLPLIARIYTPEAFGAFSQLLAYCTVVASIASLRFDLAIAIPKSEATAYALAKAALCASAIVCAAGTGLYQIGVWQEWLGSGANTAMTLLAVLLVPFSIAATQVITNMLIRDRRYGSIAKISVARSLSIGSLQLASSPLGGLGLPLGLMIGQLCSTAYALSRSSAIQSLHAVSIRRAVAAAIAYKNFAKYGSAQNLLNAVSQSAPIFISGAIFGTYEMGIYALLHRVTHAPFTLVATACRQVFLGEFALRLRARRSCAAQFVRFTIIVAALAAPGVMLAFNYGESIVVAFAGEQWAGTGELMGWFALWMTASASNTPALAVMVALRLQRQHALYEGALLVLRVVALVLGFEFIGFTEGIVLFCVVGFAANLSLIGFAWRRLLSREAKWGIGC